MTDLSKEEECRVGSGARRREIKERDMRVIKPDWGCKSLQIHNSHHHRNCHHQNHNHQKNQSCPVSDQLNHSSTLPLATRCRNQATSKPRSLFILMGVLLLNYLSARSFGPLDLILQAMSHELIPTNLTSLQQQSPPPPSQLFLPPINQRLQAVSLVNGFHQKRSEEEEGGFIMQASSMASQNETPVATTTIAPESPQTATPITLDSLVNGSGEQNVDQNQEMNLNHGDQNPIPIDVNRQQFLTHDQLSLLSASTKDESIYLSNGDQTVGEGSAKMNQSEQTPKKAPTSRSGSPSKVSQVSSFLSDLFSYATRPKQTGTEESFFGYSGSQRQPQPQSTTTNFVTTTPTTTQATGRPQVTANHCPGVCRNIFTGSIFCRNEINAPCPSLLQKCCDKDDVSFNGTPVETSAPINTADSDPNSTQLSDNTPQAQEPTQFDHQTVATTVAPFKQTQPQPPPTTTTTSTSRDLQTDIVAGLPTKSAQAPTAGNIGAGSGQRQSDSASAANPNEESNAATSTIPIDLQLGAASHPTTIYFLSSGNGSSNSERSPQAGSNQPEGAHAPTLATKFYANEEQRGSRTKQPASQSFDSPLDERNSTELRRPEANSTPKSTADSQPVTLQTANGTIVHHQQALEQKAKLRPSYANWTDYHLSILKNRQPIGQSVVYHSNIDPVKRFGSDQQTRNQQSTSPATTTTTPAAATSITTTATQSLSTKQMTLETTSQPDLNQQQPASEMMPSIKRTLALPSGPGQDSSLDVDRWPSIEEPDLQLKVKVMNDQHSKGSKQSKPESLPRQQQQAANSPQHVDYQQTTTPKSDGIDQSDSQTESSGPGQPMGGVGNVIAEWLDSWLSGSGSSAPQSAQTDQSDPSIVGDDRQGSVVSPDAHPTDQLATFASPDQPVLGDQQNDRRSGYHLSYRQQLPLQQQSQDPTNSSTTPKHYFAYDNNKKPPNRELVDPIQASMIKIEGSDQSVCIGYCTLSIFSVLCDSTYESSQCGPSHRCCVSARSDATSDTSGSPEPDGGQQVATATMANIIEPINRQQNSSGCRGACLRVYHSSLCTKPNEIQLNSAGCLPNFVCCAHPVDHQDATSNTDETDSMMGAGSSNVADQSSGHQGVRQPSQNDGLFASLLPPPPPPVSQQLSAFAEQQLNSDKGNLNDPLMATASTRQRQGPVNLLPSVSEQMYQQQAVSAVTRAPSTKTTSQSGGIMGHLYQMFKSNGSNKQRQRIQQQQQQVQFQQASNSLGYPGLNYPTMPQIYDAYQQQQQMQQNRLPAASQQQQQQIMFPVPAAHNMILSQTQFPNNIYSMGSDMSLIDTQQRQIHNNNSHRNKVYGAPQQQLQPQLPVREQPQQHQHLTGYVPANPMGQKISPQLGQVTYQNPHKLVYPQQQQLLPPVQVESVDLKQFNENNQLYGEKFAQNSEQTPTLLSFNSPTAGHQNHAIKPMSNRHQQVSPVVTAKPVVAGRQQQQLQAPGNLAFSSTLSANPNDRQRYNQASQATSSAAVAPIDNAHTAPFVQSSSKQQHQQQRYHSYSQQPLTSFAASDANNIQKQINKMEPQLNAGVQNKPIGSSNSAPVRSQQQPLATSPDQQQYHAKNGNRQQEINGAEQQKLLWRQNAVSRSTVNTVPGNVRPNGLFEVNEASGVSIRQTTNQVAPQETANNWLSVSADQQQQQLPHLSASQQNESQASPNRRVAHTNRPGTKSSTGSSAGTRTSPLPPPVDAQASNNPPLAPSPSNLNVLITNGPFIDLQRVTTDSGTHLEASRRQLLVGGNPQQQHLPFDSDGLLVPPKESQDDGRFTRLPTSVAKQNWQAASTQNDDLSHSSSSIAQILAPCPSTCLAPFVSFNCIKPDYIDENYACPSPGSICCLKEPSGFQASSSSSASKNDAHNQQNSLTTDSITDNNKLDLAQDQDDQLDEIGKQQQNQVPANTSADEAENGAIAAASSAVDEQSTSQTSKNRSQASSCGVPGSRKRATSGRVMGGSEAKPGHWCWQAALMNNKNEYLCGGALIGSKWVLTAAHCITQHLRSESQLFVRLGQHNLNTTQSSGELGTKNIQVKTSYVHHNHNGITLDNDIALLRLEESVGHDDPSICTVCLPERSSQMEPGKRCVVTGYGFADENGPAVLRVKQVDLPIVADQECQKKTGAVLGKPFTLPASSFCAGGELGQDACHGDGGSPLSCLVDGYYELAGIVSWGYKCGSKDLPGLYSKVSTFVGWINQIVSVNN